MKKLDTPIADRISDEVQATLNYQAVNGIQWEPENVRRSLVSRLYSHIACSCGIIADSMEYNPLDFSFTCPCGNKYQEAVSYQWPGFKLITPARVL